MSEIIYNIMPLYNYEDCSIGFICPRCGKDRIIDSQDGWEKCHSKCGLEYSLSAKIYFREGLCGEPK